MGGGNTTRTTSGQWFDPLGPRKDTKLHSPNGGPERRDQLYADTDNVRPSIFAARDSVVSRLTEGASTPGFANSRDLATSTIRGDYLSGSPQLEGAVSKMRAASSREAGDNAADLRSGMNRAGLTFSSAQQASDQAARATATGHADSAEANMRLGVYNQERQNQFSAPGVLREAVNAPINYLSQIGKAQIGPISDQATITQGLSGGGNIVTPQVTTYRDPSGLDATSQLIGSL